MVDGQAIFERIISTLKAKSLKRLDMCRVIGISSQNITNIKKSIPGADTAIKIASYLNVSVKWLVLGEDDVELSQGERDLLFAYNNLNEAGKKAAIGAVRGLATDFPLSSEQAGESLKTAT